MVEHTTDGRTETELLKKPWDQPPPDLYLDKKVNVLVF